MAILLVTKIKIVRELRLSDLRNSRNCEVGMLDDRRDAEVMKNEARWEIKRTVIQVAEVIEENLTWSWSGVDIIKRKTTKVGASRQDGPRRCSWQWQQMIDTEAKMGK